MLQNAGILELGSLKRARTILEKNRKSTKKVVAENDLHSFSD